jgi:hypothetical protein
MSTGRRCNQSTDSFSKSIQTLFVFLGLILIGLFSIAPAADATEVLFNRGFESGMSGWQGYSPVTWGNYGVNNDFTHTGETGQAFWARGAWSSPQPNWMGTYQNVVSAPGCSYQAIGYIFSPAGSGTHGDTTVGDFGWIGIDGTQNYAWLEVSFRNSAGAILALYKSAVFDSTSPQSTWVASPVTNACDIGNNNSVTGSVATLVAPAGTAIVRFQTVFEQANWNHGVAYFDDVSLNQVAGPVPPSISGISPDGTKLFTPFNSLTFHATSSTTDINPSGIHMTVNGLDVSSQLVIGGTARDRAVGLALKSNQVYSAAITVTDSVNFSSSANVLFDTFRSDYYVWEGEDYDVNGGQFIDNPVISSVPGANNYLQQAGIEGVDYQDTSGDGDHLYRPADRMATTVVNTDLARQKFVDAQATDPAAADYKVGWFNGGEWVNYTRTYPAGKWNVYARVDGGAGLGVVDLARVTSGQGTADQTTVNLGSFTFNGRGWATFDWVPLSDSFGNLIAVDLAGVTTLRATTHGGADLNFFMLVPAQMDRPTIANVYPDGATLFQPTNKFAFSVASPSATIPAANIQLTLNGVNVSSQLTVSGTSMSKNVTYTGLLTNRAYAAQIGATDANGNVASVSLNFDTFVPVLLAEAEDWDFDGGSFIDNAVLSSTPQAGSYFGQAGQQGIDENETTGDGTHTYRPSDAMAAGPANDVPRRNFLAAQAVDPAINDYAIGWFGGGEWVNLTRTFPAGTYNLYGRLANGNGGTATVYMDGVTGGRGTPVQTITNLGSFSFAARGWSTYDFVALRDRLGNLATVTLSGVTTLRVRAGGANVNFIMAVPARDDLPRIDGLYPNGATLLQGTNKLAFVASNAQIPIDPSGIQVSLNGADVTSQLAITGSANSRSVSVGIVPGFVNYAAVIRVTDANTNVATTTVYFDTFSPSSHTWEAEDYDYYGGQFFDNAAIGAYYGAAGVLGTDYYMDTANPPNGASYLYRTADLIATEVCTDTLLPKYATALLSDPSVKNYDVGWWLGGQWMNFTHTYPSGNFFVYGRLAGGNGNYNVQLDQLASGLTNHLGTFAGRGRGWALYDWTPLVDGAGQRVSVPLGGVTTLRATSDGNANANSFVLVPATGQPAPVTLSAAVDATKITLSFPTVSGGNYRVYYKSDLTDTDWTLLTMVAGDGSVKSVSDPLVAAKRFYRLLIQ